jgi:branched-chain amino acid transport system permease protein
MMTTKWWEKKSFISELIVVAVIAAILILVNEFGLLPTSIMLVVQYIGIYSIYVIGINMVNGYMGVFSLAHAGFMAVGAYVAAITSRYIFVAEWMFPFALLAGGLAALFLGILVAIPSFKTMGDYLAIITLGFSLIIQSILQNMEFVGASQGMNNIAKYTNSYWVFGCVLFAILIVSKFINSKYGRRNRKRYLVHH